MKLSEHFTEEELGVSEAEERVKDNARYLCHVILEPLRVLLGVPLVVTSGYRPPAANQATGGVSHSEHLYDDDHAAVDFRTPNYPMTKAFQQIRESGLGFRQAIMETDRDGLVQCIHISTRRRGTLDKHQALLGQTHGAGDYHQVSCAPVTETMPADADHEIAT